MRSDAEEKTKAILSKFRRESNRFNNIRTKIRLAKIWINILVKAEEYEMAEALRKESEALSAQMIKERRSKKSCFDKLRYKWIKFKRRYIK